MSPLPGVQVQVRVPGSRVGQEGDRRGHTSSVLWAPHPGPQREWFGPRSGGQGGCGGPASGAQLWPQNHPEMAALP